MFPVVRKTVRFAPICLAQPCFRQRRIRAADPDRARKRGANHGEPARGEPARGEPARGEPARGKPARGEPARGEPARGEPAQPAPPAAWLKPPKSTRWQGTAGAGFSRFQTGRRTVSTICEGSTTATTRSRSRTSSSTVRPIGSRSPAKSRFRSGTRRTRITSASRARRARPGRRARMRRRGNTCSRRTPAGKRPWGAGSCSSSAFTCRPWERGDRRQGQLELVAIEPLLRFTILSHRPARQVRDHRSPGPDRIRRERLEQRHRQQPAGNRSPCRARTRSRIGSP